MKRNHKFIKFITVICSILFSGFAGAQDLNPCKTGGQTCYFGVEINDVLCGYSVETTFDSILNGERIRYENTDVRLILSLLGAEVDGGFRWMYAIDPVTQQAVEIKVDIINGQSVTTAITKITDDTAYFNSTTSDVKKVIALNSDVIITPQSWYPHLCNDFIIEKVTEKKYKIYEPISGEIVEKRYVRKPDEEIILNDSIFHTIVLEETDLSSNVKSLIWLKKKDGYNVKTVTAGRNIYLADESVMSRITVANMDDELFIRVEKNIPDILSLTSLKVKAQVNSYTRDLSVESLNFPGQKFEGTVNGSLVEGIFIMEPVKYKGENAPPFPPDFSKSPKLKKYIMPELMIESDDPLIITEAQKITAGSKDSWEAAVRLGRWVAENIAYALPGGISAINTLKTQEAECGGHSRLLAAFCRSLGIPARLSIGCMYTTYQSGSFGQHAWTEIYMGDAGWIPVDATANQAEYIDAGHIKFGENATFRPVSMEILDFKPASQNLDAVIPDDYKPLLGKYMNINHYRMFSIITRNGELALDIPGSMILDLNPPDDQGRWFPELTREISLIFGDTSDGKIDEIYLHQYLRLGKILAPDTAFIELPEELRKYVGNYQSSMGRLSLDVMFDGGVMTTQDPHGRTKERIRYARKGDCWIDEKGIYEITFKENSDTEIVALVLAEKVKFVRGEPVTNAMESVINSTGIDDGLRKYDEIKNSGNSYYLFSEHMLHQLGHNLLKDNRIDEAIKVFEKNVLEYPGSFMVVDALAETYLQKGEDELAVKYFKTAVKLNPDYDYGRKMIEELNRKK